MEKEITVEQALDQQLGGLLGPGTASDKTPLPSPEVQVSEEQSASETESDEVTVEDAIDETLEGEAAETEGEETAEEETEELYTVKVNGREEQVPLHTLIHRYQVQTALDEGFKDLNRQKETVTQDKHKAESETKATIEARERYLRVIEETEKRLGNVDEIQDPPAELQETDPLRYQQMQIDTLRKRQALEQLQRERDQTLREQAADQERLLNERIQSERDLLVQKIPEWQDPAVWNQEWSELGMYAVHDLGWTPEEVSQTTDHRAIVMLRKAHAYDRMVAQGKPVAAKKAAQAAPTIKRSSKVKAAPKNATQKATEALDQANKDFHRGVPTADPVSAAIDLFLAEQESRQ